MGGLWGKGALWGKGGLWKKWGLVNLVIGSNVVRSHWPLEGMLGGASGQSKECWVINLSMEGMWSGQSGL